MSIENFKLHAVQLKALQVLKLMIEVHDPGKALSDDYEVAEYSLETGRSEFNAENSTINVVMRIRAGKCAIDEGNDNSVDKNEIFAAQPVSFLVEVGGTFEIDTTLFSPNHINHFAETNAPLIIYPYVREQVYGLSTRVGIKAMLLPLLEIPTFKIVQNSEQD
jgi:preprotein translocase subunit SecB